MERHWPASADVARGTGSRAPSRDLVLLAAAALGGLAFAVLAYSSWNGCECDKISAETEAARLVAGLSFVAAGMLALAQERFRRVGILLTLVGWTWFIYELGYIYQPIPYTAARLTDGLWQPLLAHLAVAYPSGRLRSRWNRAVVGSVEVAAYYVVSEALANIAKHMVGVQTSMIDNPVSPTFPGFACPINPNTARRMAGSASPPKGAIGSRKASLLWTLSSSAN